MVERQLPKLNVAGSSPVIRSKESRRRTRRFVLRLQEDIMTHTYTPYGVCSRQIIVRLDENDVITGCRFVGGCSGNTQGAAALVIGLKARDAIKKLKGIDCGGRGTSCPDQLAYALEEALEKN